MYKVSSIVEAVDACAVIDGQLYYFSNQCVFPTIPALDDAIAAVLSNDDFRVNLHSFGHVLCINIAYHMQVDYRVAIAVDTRTKRIFYTSDGELRRDSYSTEVHIDRNSKSVDLSAIELIYSKYHEYSQMKKHSVHVRTVNVQTSEVQVNAVKPLESLGQGKYLFSRTEDVHVLSRIDLPGNTLWRIEASGTYTTESGDVILRNHIQELIGVVNNTLWYSETCGTIVGVDVDTGRELDRIDWLRSDLPGNKANPSHNAVYGPKIFQLNESKTKMVGVDESVYVEVDLTQNQPRRKGYIVEWASTSGTYDEDLFKYLIHPDNDFAMRYSISTRTLEIYNTVEKGLVVELALKKHVDIDHSVRTLMTRKKLYVLARNRGDKPCCLIILEPEALCS